MRAQVLVLIAAAALFVAGGYFLMRGEHGDQVQDLRATRIAEDTASLAKATAVVAEAEEKLGNEAIRADARLDKLEDASADLQHRVEAVEAVIPSRKATIAAGFISKDFGMSSMAKTAVAEALMTNGTAPNSNAEAGLPAAADLHGQSLRETRVGAGGVVELVYDAKTGVDGGIIRLTPDVALAVQSGVINWRCESSDYPEISKFMPGCSYVAKN